MTYQVDKIRRTSTHRHDNELSARKQADKRTTIARKRARRAKQVA